MGSAKLQATRSMTLGIIVTVGLLSHMGLSEMRYGRCLDSVCAQNQHCGPDSPMAECWNATATSRSCTCCQNCINEGMYISQVCAQNILACHPWMCPQFRCAYGSYLLECDCCRKCLPKECQGLHDGIWPNCGILCRACPIGKKSFFCPKTCCPICITD
ncbi:uncharacterized protein LOC144139430 [Haemaphysalis longicornis]